MAEALEEVMHEPEEKTPEAYLTVFVRTIMTIWYGQYNLPKDDFEQRVEEVMAGVRQMLTGLPLTGEDFEGFRPYSAAIHVATDPRIDLGLGVCEVNSVTSDKLVPIGLEAAERSIWGALCVKSLFSQNKPG